MQVRSSSYWGWNEEAAAKIISPTLILIGEQDGLLPGAVSLFGDLSGIRNKAIVRMDCATHFAVREEHSKIYSGGFVGVIERGDLSWQFYW